MTEPETTHDQRGFVNYKPITCTYGTEVRVKESSAALYDRMWIFMKENVKVLTTPTPGEAAAHLSYKDVVELRDQMNHWLETHEDGCFLVED